MLNQTIVFVTTGWVLFALLVGRAVILWWDAVECFLASDLREGFKKFLVGLGLLIVTYFLTATMYPAIQCFVKWDKPAFLEVQGQSAVVDETVPQEKDDTPEISPPAQEEEIVEEKPKSHMPGMQ